MASAGTADGVPSARSRLFGRDEEIAQARHLLEDGARLVTITGAGGIGKTRIAMEVCRKVSGKVMRTTAVKRVDHLGSELIVETANSRYRLKTSNAA